jgi:glycosyltransferase involved in cell wall biosynthesis
VGKIMKFKPRILYIGNFLSRHTNSRGVSEDLVDKLTEAGWLVISTSNKQNRWKRVLDMVITVITHRNDYDLAHIEVYSGNAFIWAELVCQVLKILGKFFVLTLHGGNLPEFAKIWPGRVKRLFCIASVVTTPSHYLSNAMTPYYQGIRQIANSLDISNYNYKVRKDVLPKIIWLRAFHEIYNPMLVPKVIEIISREYPNVSSIMIGPDKQDGSLEKTKQLVFDLGLNKNVHFPGSISKSDVPEWLEKGDIFINTAKIDNTPVSVLEAMACGLCIISTNVGGIRFLLKDEVTALLVESDNPQVMANAIRRLLQDRELAEEISRNAYRTSLNFDSLHIIEEWKKLYLEVSHNG